MADSSARSSVIVAGARTPVGRFMGSLKDLSGAELGAVAIAGALERSGVAPSDVQYVIMGQVLTAGAGQVPARQAAVAAGIPMAVPALTINKVCLSGLEAIVLADQLIRAGAFDIVVAGGQESMSRAPRLLVLSREGAKPGAPTIRDHLARDGLWDAFTDQGMGALTEACNSGSRFVGRAEQDAFSARSHRLARRAQRGGVFEEEIVPVRVRGSAGSHDGSCVDFCVDEGPQDDVTAQTLAELHPAYRRDGTITSGSASASSDGACAVVVMERGEARRRGLTPLAAIGAPGVVAGPDSSLQDQPAHAIEAACKAEGIDLTDLDLVEINEAFAAIPLVSSRRLGLDPDKVNVNGGAIALGHPLGASGARILLHLALELTRRGGGVGAAAVCGGGGQGEALIIRTPGVGGPTER